MLGEQPTIRPPASSYLSPAIQSMLMSQRSIYRVVSMEPHKDYVQAFKCTSFIKDILLDAHTQ